MEGIEQSAAIGSNAEEEFLSSLEKVLTSIGQNLSKISQNAGKSPSIFIRDEKSRNMSVNDSTKCLVRLYPETLLTEARQSRDESEPMFLLQQKFGDLQTQLDKEMQEKRRLQEEVNQLKDQILHHSTYCANLGAVLGSLTWRASNMPQIVDVWLSKFQRRIAELLKILNGSFVSFISTYESALPPVSNVEYQFMFALLGIVTNITASPEGREFVIKNPDGKEFVYNVKKLFPKFPVADGSTSLKRLMLTTLYNVSMNKTGLQHLLQVKVGEVLNHCLETDSSHKRMQLLCLRVLQSITYDLSEPEYIRDLIASISIDKVQGIASSGNDNLSALAKQIVEHLKKLQKFLEPI